VTLGGGGVKEMTHLLFLLFETLFLMHLEGKLFDTKQDNASKDTFFLIHFNILKKFRPKSVIKKLKNVTWGGGEVRKVPKKCHVLFERPLRARGNKLFF
jgi:hypothetical protein